MIREYNDNDYITLCEWWVEHKWGVIPMNCLPKVGFVVNNICAGFLYQTDSKIAWLEWIISNPQSNKEERDVALDLLINQLLITAKELGFKLVFTSVKHPKLKERYLEHGFLITENNSTEMVRNF